VGPVVVRYSTGNLKSIDAKTQTKKAAQDSLPAFANNICAAAQNLCSCSITPPH